MVRIAAFALFLAALAYALVPREVPQDGLSGAAKVVDGDTFWLGETKVRVYGIDAPEAADPLGPAATAWLTNRVRGQTVSCVERDVDQYGRIVAQCSVAGEDLAEQMTEAGLARAYRRFTTQYVAAENRAKSANLGIWSNDGETKVTLDCPIKGNISGSGRKLYHRPSDRSYSGTRINEANGERWFCSEAEALSAGWKPANP